MFLLSFEWGLELFTAHLGAAEPTQQTCETEFTLLSPTALQVENQLLESCLLITHQLTEPLEHFISCG